MDREAAHRILTKHASDQNQECRCHACDKAEGFLEGYEHGMKQAAEIADRIAGELQVYDSETGGMEEVIVIRNLILKLIKGDRRK